MQPIVERDGLLLDDGANVVESNDNLLAELYNAPTTDYDTDVFMLQRSTDPSDIHD